MRYLPCYTHYRRFPNRIVKFILPLPPTSINPWLARINTRLQLTTILGEFCLQLFWFSLHKAWDWASRWPTIYLVSEERSPLLLRITRLTWKIHTTLVDTWAIRAYKTWYLFEGLEFGTYKFTWNGRQIPYIGRYSGLMWNNFGV